MSHSKNIQGTIILYILTHNFSIVPLSLLVCQILYSKNCDENLSSHVEHERNYQAFKIRVYLSDYLRFAFLMRKRMCK
jgi:hypothetical protein